MKGTIFGRKQNGVFSYINIYMIRRKSFVRNFWKRNRLCVTIRIIACCKLFCPAVIRWNIRSYCFIRSLKINFIKLFICCTIKVIARNDFFVLFIWFLEYFTLVYQAQNKWTIICILFCGFFIRIVCYIKIWYYFFYFTFIPLIIAATKNDGYQ